MVGTVLSSVEELDTYRTVAAHLLGIPLACNQQQQQQLLLLSWEGISTMARSRGGGDSRVVHKASTQLMSNVLDMSWTPTRKQYHCHYQEDTGSPARGLGICLRGRNIHLRVSRTS